MSERQEQKYNNVWGYIRWSSDGQEEGNTELRQAEYIEAMAKRLGKVPIKTYIDRGVSALKGDNLKAEWANMKAMLQAGDVVLVEGVDRITRMGLRTFLEALGEVVVDRGAYIKLTAPSAGGMEINRDNYEKNWNILMGNVVSSEEGAKRLERIRNGQDRMMTKLRSGKWAAVGSVPWWIISDKDKECYTVDETKAAIVREMFAMYNDGMSGRRIVKALNDRGIKPRRNDKWSLSSVRNILKGKAVLGYFNSSLENIKLYPAIVTEEVYWHTQSKMNERKRYTGIQKHDEASNLLLSRIFCAECDSSIGKVGKHLKSHHKHDTYRCSGGMKKNICNLRCIRVAHLEESLRMMLSVDTILTKFVTSGQTPTPYRLDTLRLQLADIRKKEAKLAAIITNDDEPSQALLKSLKEVEAEGRKLSIEISREEATIRAASPTVAMVRDAITSKLLEKWNEPKARLQIRELLRSIIKKVRVNLTEKWYEVTFKCEQTEPVRVQLAKDGYTIEGQPYKWGAKNIC